MLLLAAAIVLAAAPASPEPASTSTPRGDGVRTADVLRIPFPKFEGSLTPYTFQTAYPLVTLIYDTLLWRDVDGVPQPWLASNVTMSPDGREVLVELRDDARWHDGVPVTAEDVAFTLAFVFGRFHPRFTPQLAAMEKVTVVDDLTVRIDLRAPSPGFIDQPLTDLPILPRHLWDDLPVEQLAPDGPTIGSGPYRLVEINEDGDDEGYRLEAVTDYHRGPPAVDVVEVPIITESVATLDALSGRDVDVLPITIPARGTDALNALGITIEEGDNYLGTVLVMNTIEPPFDDPALRRGVRDALDLTRLRRTVGEVVSAERGLLHPASTWASQDVLQAVDVGAATAALASLGDEPLSVLVPDNDPRALEAANQVVLALRRAGAQATAEEVPADEVASRLGDDDGTRDFALAISTTPSLASYDPVFVQRLYGTDGDRNVSGYTSAAFDVLATEIATQMDDEQRRAAVQSALELLAEDVPSVPLYFTRGAFVVRPSVYDGWVYVRGSGIIDKRSFVEPRVRGLDAPDATAPTPNTTSNPLATVTTTIAIVLAAITSLLIVVGLVRRRRR